MQPKRSNATSHPNFGRALRWARDLRGLPQEQFDQVSSRTYVSALERGLKDPTLRKVDSLAGVLQLHPLALVALSYVDRLDTAALEALLTSVSEELGRAIREGAPKADRQD